MKVFASCTLLVLTMVPTGTAFGIAVEAIPKQSIWKYRDTPVELATAWKDSAFDDSSWPSGPAILGYGESFIRTPIPFGPDPNQKYTTTYFRKTFELTGDPADVVHLFLYSKYDDGFIAYLNGQEVLRRSMPGDPITYSTFAFSHEATSYEFTNLAAHREKLVEGTNVVAVELHQTSLTSSDLVFDTALSYSTDPEVILRGPYLQVATPTSVIVRWRTNLSTSSEVRFGETLGAPSDSTTDATATMQHEVEISGLQPDRRYYYTIGATDHVQAGDATYTFVTPPAHGTVKTTRLWVIGDSGQPGKNQDQVRNAYTDYRDSLNTDVWLMLGDNAYNDGTDFEYQQAVFDAYPYILRSTFLWPTRGNHDNLHGGTNNDYYELFTMPTAGEAGGLASGTEAYYSFDYSNVHFICLDSDGSDRSLASPMLQWLRSDLAATTQDWIIAFWHHPPYTKGSHDSDNAGDSGGRMRDMRENVLPILDSTGVDLVLTGHSHSYERSFLLNGHYGLSGTLSDTMKIDDGDGREAGNGAYSKPTPGPGPFEGAVYAVAGNASKISGGTLNHPVMVESFNVLGSMAIDITGNRLDARLIDDAGAALDSFTIIKGTPVDVPPIAARTTALRLGAIHPNPAAGPTIIEFTLPRATRARLTVHDVTGRRLRTLVDRSIPSGQHRVSWAGVDDSGHSVPAGVYFVLLEQDGERRARQIVRLD